MTKLSISIAAAVLLFACTRTREPPRTREPATTSTQTKPPSPYPDEFWKTWRDGKAEVSAFDVTLPGGQRHRRATAIVVFELERFSSTRRVKAENHRGSDVFPVMKMHVLREFMPGAGDALTVFAALEPVNGHPAGNTTKVTFAAWDWSGSLWRQMLLTGKHARLSWHSYAEDEADGQSTRVFGDQYGVPEDSLPMAARRIAWPVLRLGQTESYAAIASVTTPRVHTDRSPFDITLSLTRERSTTVVPAGSFRTHTFRAESKPLTGTWRVEADPPHRIVRWETSDGETGVLLGADRMEASELSGGDVAGALRRLGIPPGTQVP